MGVFRVCKELLPSLEQHSHHLDSLSQQMRVLIGIMQRMDDVLRDAFGLPAGDPYIIDQAAPVAGTLYDGAKVPQAAILRQLSISQHGGAGIITLYLKSAYALGDPRVPGTPSGARVIWRGSVGADVPVQSDFRIRIPAGSTLSISTNGAAVTNLNLNAVIDQVDATAVDSFYGRR